MTLDEAKDLFRNDKDAYGKPRKLLTKIEQVYIAAYNKAIEDAVSYLQDYPEHDVESARNLKI